MESSPPTAGLPAESPSAASAVQVPQEILDSLAQCRPWMRLCMTLAYIAAGLMWLGGALAIFSSLINAWALPFALLYAALGFLYYLPARGLSRSAWTINRVLETGSPDHLESALEEQRRFWKLVGILACAGFVIWVISIAGFSMFYSRGRF